MNLPEFLNQTNDGAIHITGHRIGIEDVVHCYNEGFSPELLSAEFPTLSLVLIHKVLGFYLENRSEIDAHLGASAQAIETARAKGSKGPSLAELSSRMRALGGASL